MTNRIQRYYQIIVIALGLMGAVWGQSPTIVSTTPSQNALNVSVNSTITVYTDQLMDAATIDTNTMVVSGNFTGLITGAYSTVDSSTTFTPSQPFMVGEKISITLTTGIQSGGGTPMASPYTWEFTV